MIEQWSHSKLNMLTRCARQFWYRYVMGLKIPPNSNLSFGKAYHSTLEANFTQKKRTKRDLSWEQATTIFSDEWDHVARDLDWKYEEAGKGNLKDMGIRLVGDYITNLAPKRKNPTFVEFEFKIELPETDKPFVGVIDLITDANGELLIYDHKTSGRRWPNSRADQELQPTAYYLAYQGLFGILPPKFTYDIAVKTKNSYVYEVSTKRTERDIEDYKERLIVAEQMLDKEIFPKTTPDNWLCNPRYCGYYNHCMRGTPLSQLRLQEDEEPYGI